MSFAPDRTEPPAGTSLFMTAQGDISMSQRGIQSAAPMAMVVARIGCGVNSQSQKDMHISAYLGIILYNILKIR